MKDRLTDPLRIPINFIKGPLIGWNAPKAFVSDMGALAMPQFVFAAAIGGSSDTAVLEPADVAANPLIVPGRELHRGGHASSPAIRPRTTRSAAPARPN